VTRTRRSWWWWEDEYALAVGVERSNTVTTVHVIGEIDSLTGADLQAVIYEQLADRPLRLIVDLSQVAVLGSTGLAILGRAKDACLQRGIEMSLAGSGREDVVRQLKITGLERLLVALSPSDSQPRGGIDAAARA
jgi:anti-sigma B factor antagonist